MACPSCSTTEAKALPDGRFQCLGNVVVNAVPPGMGGNAGPAAIPIYGTCGYVYTAEQAREADAAVAQARAAADARSRALSERTRIDNDSETPGRIASLAARLIEDRPSGTVPVVVPVEISSRNPFAGHASGFAEVYRAWPIGTFKFPGHGENGGQGRFGIAADGRTVLLSSQKPSVSLTPRMRWRDPRDDQDLRIWDSGWRATVLELLQTADAEPLERSESKAVAEPLVGRPRSKREGHRLERLRRKAFELHCDWDRLFDLYGSRDLPKTKGRPRYQDRKVWREMDAIERKYIRLQPKIRAIDPTGPWGNRPIHPSRETA